MRQKPGTTCLACKKAKRKCVRLDEDQTKSCINCLEKGKQCIPQEIKPREVKLGKRQELVRDLFGIKEIQQQKTSSPSTPVVSSPNPFNEVEKKLSENTLKIHWMIELIDEGWRPCFSVGFIPGFRRKLGDLGMEMKSEGEYSEIVMLMFMVYGARKTSNPCVLGSLRLPQEGIYSDFRPYGRAREGPCRSLLSKLLDNCFSNAFLSKPSLEAVTILLDVFLLIWREFEPAFCSETIRNRRWTTDDQIAGLNEELAWQCRKLLKLVKTHLDFYTYIGGGEEWIFQSQEYGTQRFASQEIERFIACDLANSASLNIHPLMTISDFQAYNTSSSVVSDKRSFYSLSSLINESMTSLVTTDDQDTLSCHGLLCLQRQVIIGSIAIKEWLSSRQHLKLSTSNSHSSISNIENDLSFAALSLKSSFEIERDQAKSPTYLLSSLMTRMDLYSAFRRTTHWVDMPSGQVWGPVGKENIAITRENLVQRSTCRFIIFALAQEVLEVLKAEKEMKSTWGLLPEEIEVMDRQIELAEGVVRVAKEKAHEHIDGLLESFCDLEMHPMDKRSLRFYDCVRELIMVLQELPGGTPYLAKYISSEPKPYLRAEKAARVQNFLHLNKTVGWFSMGFDRNVQLLENDLMTLFPKGQRPPSPGYMKVEEENDALCLKVMPLLNWDRLTNVEVRFKPDVTTVPEDSTFMALKIVRGALADISRDL